VSDCFDAAFIHVERYYTDWVKTQVTQKPCFKTLLETKSTYLNDNESQVLEKMSEDRKHDYLAGRRSIKELAEKSFGIEPLEITINYNDSKPYFDFMGYRYYCSISHSKSFVASFISSITAKVGIDVEDLTTRHPALLEYIADQSEIAFFDSDQRYISVKIWNIKETALKVDSKQVPISQYRIVDFINNSWCVMNTKTHEKFFVRNLCTDSYTLSYIV